MNTGIDEKEKSARKAKRKLSPVDIIIIILAVAAIIAVVYFGVTLLTDGVDIFKSGAEPVSDSEYKVKIYGLDASMYSISTGADNVAGCASLNLGDTVYDGESGKPIGKISALSYENYSVSTDEYDSDGKLIYADYPGYVNLIITIEATEDDSKLPLSVNGRDIRTGDTLFFRTYGFTATGSIIYVGEVTHNTASE